MKLFFGGRIANKKKIGCEFGYGKVRKPDGIRNESLNIVPFTQIFNNYFLQ
jgi:hypothetical protein